jgi:hypothetical protein
MKQIKINNELIKKLNLCENRHENYLKYYKNTSFSILEFLDLDNITASDKIWVMVRVLPIDIIEIFTLDCAFAAYDAYADAAYADDADTDAYAAAAYAADAAAAYAADADAAAAYDAAAYAADAAAAARENQVDCLIMLINM